MNKHFKQSLQLTLIVLDLFMLNFIWVTAHYVILPELSTELLFAYYNFWAFLNISWIVVTWAGQVYNEKHILSFESFTRRTVKVYLIWVGIIMLYYFFKKSTELSRLFIALSLLVYMVGILLNRFSYLGLKEYFKKKKFLYKRVLILGYNDLAQKLAFYLEEEGINTKILGFAEDYNNVQELTRYPIVSEIKDTIEVSKQLNVNEVLSTITPEQNKDIYALMKQADNECVHFRFIPDFSFFIKKPVHIEYLKDMPILALRSEPLEDVSNRLRKRIMDVVISALVIVFILSWLIPLIGLLIYLESPGPIFFVQLRSGKRNKPFRCLKFRSMHVNRESDIKQATKKDSRVTRVGSFLRKSSLDEFPQFINVFKGEMSLVGPRPHMIRHTEDYSKIVDDYMIRHFLKPGITGWAQINGCRGEITLPSHIQKRVELDLNYLENWSLWLDIKIMFLTVYNIVKGDKQAY
ncbi:MAG: undecaprenyl-phosphate glucose phosphotransferase [Bacteroidota bacterium]|nr:undecaprenyl-phosphate glucose phosphotransferase [Bacteroidota bacterium]